MAVSTNAFSTKGVQLQTSATAAGTYAKLVDIKDYPDLGTAPDKIEVTTLTDSQKRYIAGLKDVGDNLEFTCNYVKADYDAVSALDDDAVHYFALAFGNAGDGADGIFYFGGQVKCWMVGHGVGEVTEFKISITPTNAITTTKPAA